MRNPYATTWVIRWYWHPRIPTPQVGLSHARSQRTSGRGIRLSLFIANWALHSLHAYNILPFTNFSLYHSAFTELFHQARHQALTYLALHLDRLPNARGFVTRWVWRNLFAWHAAHRKVKSRWSKTIRVAVHECREDDMAWKERGCSVIEWAARAMCYDRLYEQDGFIPSRKSALGTRAPRSCNSSESHMQFAVQGMRKYNDVETHYPVELPEVTWFTAYVIWATPPSIANGTWPTLEIWWQ